MPPKQYPVQNDLALLLPSFRVRVEQLLGALKARGLNPRVFETRRTIDRAIWLQKSGKSDNGPRSIHCYDAAVDVIDAEHGWDRPGFFIALGEEAKRIGLTHGIRIKRGIDWPHVQAIPVAQQDAFRALTTPLERDAFVERVLSSKHERR